MLRHSAFWTNETASGGKRLGPTPAFPTRSAESFRSSSLVVIVLEGQFLDLAGQSVISNGAEGAAPKTKLSKGRRFLP
jgi:hypothetical protein